MKRLIKSAKQLKIYKCLFKDIDSHPIRYAALIIKAHTPEEAKQIAAHYTDDADIKYWIAVPAFEQDAKVEYIYRDNF